MRSVIATLIVNTDVEDGEDAEDVARTVMIDLLQSGCDITITEESA